MGLSRNHFVNFTGREYSNGARRSGPPLGDAIQFNNQTPGSRARGRSIEEGYGSRWLYKRDSTTDDELVRGLRTPLTNWPKKQGFFIEQTSRHHRLFRAEADSILRDNYTRSLSVPPKTPRSIEAIAGPPHRSNMSKSRSRGAARGDFIKRIRRSRSMAPSSRHRTPKDQSSRPTAPIYFTSSEINGHLDEYAEVGRRRELTNRNTPNDPVARKADSSAPTTPTFGTITPKALATHSHYASVTSSSGGDTPLQEALRNRIKRIAFDNARKAKGLAKASWKPTHPKGSQQPSTPQGYREDRPIDLCTPESGRNDLLPSPPSIIDKPMRTRITPASKTGSRKKSTLGADILEYRNKITNKIRVEAGIEPPKTEEEKRQEASARMILDKERLNGVKEIFGEEEVLSEVKKRDEEQRLAKEAHRKRLQDAQVSRREMAESKEIEKQRELEEKREHNRIQKDLQQARAKLRRDGERKMAKQQEDIKKETLRRNAEAKIAAGRANMMQLEHTRGKRENES